MRTGATFSDVRFPVRETSERRPDGGVHENHAWRVSRADGQRHAVLLDAGPDLEAEGRLSQRKLAALAFEAAAFGHGKAITRSAAARFHRAFARR